MADIDKAFHGELAYTATPGNSFYQGTNFSGAAAVGVAAGPGSKPPESKTASSRAIEVAINKA